METLMERAIYYRGIAITYYKRFETPILSVLKFFIGLFVFSSINGFFTSFNGGVPRLASLPVILLAAVLASILPPTWFFMLTWLFITANIYFVSLEFAVIIGLSLLCLMFFYIRIFPKESLLIILLLVCFKLKIPYFVPLFAGLFVGIGSVGALIIGVLLWFMMPNAEMLKSGGSSISELNILELPQTFGDSLKTFLDAVSADGPWVYMALVFVVSAIAVWVISRLSLPYSMEIGLGVGGLALIVGMLTGMASSSAEGSVFGVIASVLASMLLAYICKFFYIIVDYS